LIFAENGEQPKRRFINEVQRRMVSLYVAGCIGARSAGIDGRMAHRATPLKTCATP
jgi:hypothetical protein